MVQVWWCTSIVSALGKLRQEDYHTFWANLGYRENPNPGRLIEQHSYFGETKQQPSKNNSQTPQRKRKKQNKPTCLRLELQLRCYTVC